MVRGRGRDSSREAKWRAIIGGHGRSGLTIREFCRRRKLTESAFYFWRRELQRRGNPRSEGGEGEAAAAAVFVPVSLLQEDSAPGGGRIEIELPGGWRVLVTPPVDRQSLADVVAVLAATRTSMDAHTSQSPAPEAIAAEAGRC